MPRFLWYLLGIAVSLYAVEQEQPTPYDLVRPIWPMTWDTAATDNGGTVESFSQYVPNLKKHNTVPPVGSVPKDFKPNGYIPDSLNQAFRDAQNLRISRIRVNQAGYLPDDAEKQFYYVSDGTCGESYSVVDLEGNVVFQGGTFANSGKTTASSWVIKAGTDAATADQGRYATKTVGPSGAVCIGYLAQAAGLEVNTRYRIKVLNQYSSTFIISDKVYSMVRDATLKFYGINRSGNSESWFHKPSHTKDGGGKFVGMASDGKTAMDVTGFTPKEGALQGGWYDCGDHLKESQTQAYAFMVLAVMAASNPDRDEDHYAYNQAEAQNTDGVPDILREAKHGADFFMRAYNFADGVIDNMAVSVGNFGADHGWWGRPENQDALPATLKGRGGPHERDIRLSELGSNISGQIAAGLAILSVDYAPYDKAFADSCLIVAEKMYDFAKNLKLKEKNLGPGTYDGGKNYVYNTKADGWSSSAYNGNNESHDDLAIAAIALHYATYEKTGKMDYLNDAVEDTQIGSPQEASIGFFHGGWMAWNRDGMRKSSKNTSWANAYTYALYGFYKMLLKDTETGLKYGIDDKTRLTYAENVALLLGTNISYLSANGSNSITIPTLNGPTPVTFGDLWYNMQTDQTWIYNRYQAGNIFEVLAYSDVTKDLEGLQLPQKGVQNWNSAEMKKLGINQLNYMLGVNPWDVSFLLGVGDKNDAHPHHRAANPEGRNMPGSSYKYNPPTGALFGGITPNDVNAWDPDTISWTNYHISETCIDATAMFVASCAVAVREEDRNRAPSQVNVEIRYVGYDSAIVKISQDVRGPAMILYSTNETGPFNIPAKDTVNGVSHEIHLTGLQNGTTYYFKVIAINVRSEAYTTKWLVDSTNTPFTFTTLVSPPADADIQNVKVCNLTSDTAEIMWYTPNGQYESKIYWDTTLTSYDKMAWNTGDINADVSGIPTSFHYVKIGGLKEKTTYYYCVESNGTRRCVDDKGMPLKFTTPVTHYDFSVNTYQYYEQGLTGMDRININLFNNEDRQFDSLELRFYVTAKPEQMEPQEGVNNQPGSCPLMIDEEICQAYDEAGFNKPCETDREIRDLLRGAPPIKLPDTYNPATGTYDWYIPVPLGSTMIKSSSRMRLDLAFSKGYYQNGKCDPLYQPADKRMSAETGDWTWRAHKRDEDGADYDGMPVWDKDQGDFEAAPVNPYVAVYRKDEFIVGFSPSYQEMATKRAHYDIALGFEAPFNVSNGSYIQIDSSTSTMHLRGVAQISESGYVTSIWVNGVALSKEQLSKAAVYNSETGKFDLDIPVKMTIGTNKVDVTVFAGPNPECEECQENGGCAFVNRSYYVQFSKGDRTQGKLLLLTEDGSSVVSPAKTDGSLKFQIQLRDKDNRGNSSVTVALFNSRTPNDSVIVTLNRTDAELGYFSSDWLNAVAEDKPFPKVPFYGGDTVMVKYVDIEDEDDRDSVWFFSNPTKPIPQTASLISDVCTVTGDAVADMTLAIEFSGSLFDGRDIILDSVIVAVDANGNFAGNTFKLEPSATVMGASATFTFPESSVGVANPTGTVTVYMRERGTASSSTVSITDKVKPKLISVSILENENHASAQDTIKVAFSEPVNFLSLKTQWPFAIYDNGSEVAQSTIKVVSATTDDDGKSWEYVVEGNDQAMFIKPGFMAEIAGDFKIADMIGNSLATCAPVQIIEAVRPVPIQYATISDATGDGQPDEIYIEFVRKLRDKDVPDTVDVYWGNPAVYQAFVVPAAGWTREIIQGETTQVPVTRLDSTNGTWIKGAVKKVCVEYKDDTTYVTKKNYTYTYLDEDSTVIADSTLASIDTLSSTVTQKCSRQESSQDSTFIPKIDTIGYEDVVAEREAIRIQVPEGVYKKVTYGPKNGNGTVIPRKGPIESLFGDPSGTLLDRCPPVIVKATWMGYELRSGLQMDILTVDMSEPLDSVPGQQLLLERMREGNKGVYYNPTANPELKVASSGTTSFKYTYSHDANEAFWIADSVRLVPDATMSYYKDMAGLFAGVETPWVPVTGVVSNVRVKVEVVEGVTTSKPVEFSYGGLPVNPAEMFRLTAIEKDESTRIIAAGGSTLQPVNSAPIKNYQHAGPVFKMYFTLPGVFDETALGDPKRDYSIKFHVDFFTNLGTFVNSTSYTIRAKDVWSYITPASELTLYLEWVAPEDYPVSSKGKKIGTGPYISKFDYKVVGAYVAKESDAGEDTNDIKKNDTFTKTFGFKRAKKR